MYVNKLSSTVFAVALIMSFSLQAKSEPIAEQVFGKEPLTTWTNDALGGGSAVKNGVYSFAKECGTGTVNTIEWTKGVLKTKGALLLHVVYQSAKMVLGCAGVYYPLPLRWFGVRIQNDKIVYTQGKFGSFLHQVPSRLVGVVAIYHGLLGLAREYGLDGLIELVSKLEGFDLEKDRD